MKAERVHCASFVRALDAISSFIGPSLAQPFGASPFFPVPVTFRAGSEGLTMSVSVADGSLSFSVPAVAQEEGTVHLADSTVLALLSVLKSGWSTARELSFRESGDDEHLRVSADPDSHMHLRKFWPSGSDPTGIPRPDEDTTRFAVPCAALAELLRTVAYASEKDDVRTHLKGVLLEGHGDHGLAAFAVSHHRSAQAVTGDLHGIDSRRFAPVVLPDAVAAVLGEHLPKTSRDDDVEILVGSSSVLFRCEGFTCLSVLRTNARIAALRPAPGVVVSTCRLDHRALLHVLDLPPMNGKVWNPSVVLDFGGTGLRVGTGERTYGRFEAFVSVCDYAGPPVTLHVNPSCLRDALTAVDRDGTMWVRVGLRGATGAISIYGRLSEHLLMPMAGGGA